MSGRSEATQDRGRDQMFEEHRAGVGRWVVLEDLGTRTGSPSEIPALLFTPERSSRITVVCSPTKPQGTERNGNG